MGVAVLAGLWFSEPVAPPIRPGQPAPAFSLPALDGGTVALDSLRGRVVLLNFWATWCKPCLDEMPAMERLYQALSDRASSSWRSRWMRAPTRCAAFATNSR